MYVCLKVEREIVTDHKSKKDSRRSGGGQRKPTEMLEKAADLIMGCFRTCVSDK